jgi:transposase-like protein
MEIKFILEEFDFNKTKYTCPECGYKNIKYGAIECGHCFKKIKWVDEYGKEI